MTNEPHVHPAENRAPQIVPCRSCGAPLSPYVNKCPNCGHHTHKLSQEEQSRKQSFRQMMLLMGLGILVFALAMVAMWFFGGGADAIFPG